MRVAALSDLHIGLYGRTDACGHDAGAFASLLDQLLATDSRS